MNLPEIPFTPDADPQVQLNLDSKTPAPAGVHRLRDEWHYFRAAGQSAKKKISDYVGQFFVKLQSHGYAALLNQLICKQLRRCSRARCNITHRLVAEMPKTLQISSLGISSISRNVNALAMRFGRGDKHLTKIFQNSSCSTSSAGVARHSTGAFSGFQ